MEAQMAASRKRSSKGKRRRTARGWQPLKYLGAAVLGAVIAVAATAQLGLPKLPDLDWPTRPGARVEQTAKAEPRSRAPAVRRPDTTIRTSAVARPPLPVPAQRPETKKPLPVVVRPPATPTPKVDVPNAPKHAALPAAPDPKATRLSGLAFPICGEGPGGNCVIDGDTFVLNGKAIRIADIDTPESGDPKCRREAMLAARAKLRLQQLLNAGPLELRATGRDQDIYGRKLRTVHRDGRSLGDTLIGEGLARRWTGAKKSWCA
jgi:endonuclease YncB( thermonuclease family)